MWWLKVLALALILKRFETSLVSSYVTNLLANFNENDQNSHDFGVFCINKIKLSEQKVRDVCADICKAIPEYSPVHFSPSNKLIQNRGLRVASLNIIVSDVSDTVRILFYATRTSIDRPFPLV